jgi:hypothetical protein
MPPRTTALRRTALRVRAEGASSNKAALLSKMEQSLAEYKSLPPSMVRHNPTSALRNPSPAQTTLWVMRVQKEDGSLEASATVLAVLNDLKAGGEYSKCVPEALPRYTNVEGPALSSLLGAAIGGRFGMSERTAPLHKDLSLWPKPPPARSRQHGPRRKP